MPDYRISVVVDPSRAATGSRQVKRELDGVRSTADRLRNALLQTFAAAGITAGIAGSIRLLADFEQSMASVRAVSGATESQFQALRDEAKRLGSTTRFSASQAAEGMLFLSRAGFSADESLKAIGGTLKLAQAGAIDLGSAADIASNILSGFRLEAEQTGRVVDVLALAANSSNTDIRQLGDAMKFVAPVAAGLGIEIEETAAAIGVLSDAGLQGSLAGTGLRRVLSELESPSENSRKILKSLGVTVEEIIPSQVGLTAALERLAVAGVDTGTALEIFGDRGGPAFEVLSAGIPRVKSLTEELNNAEGAADRIARIMDDNLNGALLAVRSAFEGLILEIGDAGATGIFTRFFAVMAEGIRFLSTNVDLVIETFEALAIVLAVNLASQAIPAAVAALRTLAVAIAANPIGAIATVITVVTASLIAFGDRLSLTANSAATAFDFISLSAELMGAVLVQTFDNLRGILGGFERDTTDIHVTFLDVVRGIAVATDILGQSILSLGDFISVTLIGIFEVALNIILGTLKRITQGINIAIDALNALGGDFELIDTSRFENKLAGATEQAALAAADRLRAAFTGNGVVAQAVDALGAEAEARAKKRQIENVRGLLRSGESRGGAPSAPGAAESPVVAAAGSRPAAGVEDRSAALEREIDLITREGEVLRATGVERSKLQAIIATETQLRQQLRAANSDLSEERLNELSTLTEAERALIGGIVEQNAILEQQGEILSNINDPVESYRLKLASLNDLLEKGAISQAAFNAELANTSLIADLTNLDAQLFGPFGEGLQAQTDMLRAQQAEQQLIVEEALEARILTEEEAAQRIAQIDRQAAAARVQANLASYGLIFGQARSTFGGIADVVKQSAGEQSKAYKGLFAASQAFALGQAVVGTASGVAQALGSGPPPYNFILAALVGAAGAVQVATIVGQTLALADGGFVTGPGGPRSDQVPAMLSNGEFVVNAAATARNRGLLEAINSGRADVGGGTTNISINVDSDRTSADDFRRSSKQVAADLSRELDVARRRNR